MPSETQHETLSRFAAAAYTVATVFLLTPLIDVIANVGPLELGNIQWRFGAFGIMSNYLVSGLFGLSLGVLWAALLSHRKALWAFTAASLAVAAVLVLASGLYALDVLQLRQQVRPEAVDAFKIGALKSEAKTVMAAAALVVLGLAGFRSVRGAKGAEKGREKDAPLIVR